MNDAELRSLERLCSKDDLSDSNVATLTALGLKAAQALRLTAGVVADLEQSRERHRMCQENLATTCAERDALIIRRDELLAAMVRVTRETPYPEEAGNAGVLIAEVGTLRAERDRLRAELAESQRIADLRGDEVAKWAHESGTAKGQRDKLKGLLAESIAVATRAGTWGDASDGARESRLRAIAKKAELRLPEEQP